jgi:hypothetical protein
MKAIKQIIASPGIILPKYPVVYKENNNYIIVSSEIANATIKLAKIKKVNKTEIPEYNKNTINVSLNNEYEVGRVLFPLHPEGKIIKLLYMLNLKTGKQKELFILLPNLELRDNESFICENLEF